MNIFLFFLLLHCVSCWGSMREEVPSVNIPHPRATLGLLLTAEIINEITRENVAGLINNCWEINSRPSLGNIITDVFFYRLIPMKTQNDNDFFSNSILNGLFKYSILNKLSIKLKIIAKGIFGNLADNYITSDESYVINGISNRPDWNFYSQCNLLYLNFLNSTSITPSLTDNAVPFVACDILVASSYVENTQAEQDFFNNVRTYFDNPVLSRSEKNKLHTLLHLLGRAALAKTMRNMMTYYPQVDSDIQSFEINLAQCKKLLKFILSYKPFSKKYRTNLLLIYNHASTFLKQHARELEGVEGNQQNVKERINLLVPQFEQMVTNVFCPSYFWWWILLGGSGAGILGTVLLSRKFLYFTANIRDLAVKIPFLRTFFYNSTTLTLPNSFGKK